MATILFTVPGISCGHCVNTIERAVNEVEGVGSVSGNIEQKSVLVQFEAPATRDQIVAAMTEWEYPPSTEKAVSA